MTPTPTTTTARRRALVVRGGWDGHHPVEATDAFLPFLEREGFDIRLHDGPAIYADADAMAGTDLIVQCVTMSTIEPAALKGLRDAVAAGTGLAGWHGGIVDSYRDQPDYLQLVGGQFAAHPAGADGQDANDVTYTVTPTEAGRDHEILRGIAPFELTTEQYWVLTDDLDDVLATTTHPTGDDRPWARPLVSPAVWTRTWGAGRVFVATPGHDPAVLADPSVRTIIERGMVWASRTA